MDAQAETTNGSNPTIKQEPEQPADNNGVEVKQEATQAPAPEPTPAPPVAKGQPIHEMVGGSLVRRYLNQHLTTHLLEGLKLTSQTKPEDPLKFLGEFLIKRSSELSTNDTTNP